MPTPQGHAPVLRVELLGPARVLRDGVEVPVSGLTLRRLLVRLVLARGRAVSAQQLADCVWPEDVADAPGNRKASLQSLVSRLRRIVGADRLVQQEPGYLLTVDESDLRELRGLLRNADASLPASPADAQTAAEQALALQRGEPLEDVAGLPWAAAEIARLQEELDQARLVLARAARAQGARGPAVRALQPLHQREPERLDVAELLARALGDLDRGPDALAVIDRTARALGGRLGLDLSPGLQSLRLSLLRGEYPPAVGRESQKPASAPPAAPRTTTTSGSTEQPQKASDLGGPPASLSAFIGRQDVIDDALGTLRSHRLVTFVGPGGAGKTRTALEVARSLAADGARVGIVELAGLPTTATGQEIEGHLARDLRLPALEDVTAQRPASKPIPSLRERLADHLTPAAVIVLDNCEHLLEPVAGLVELLLTSVPGLRVVATSREPLALDGEQLIALVGLELPEHAGLADAETAPAVRLFVERAASADRSFRLTDQNVAQVVEIVRSLDGLPLALELAAARLRVMSLTDLHSGLQDRFAILVGGSRTKAARHRSLRDLIGWSWEPLTASERAVLERFSVFAGGASLESLTAVCRDLADEPTVERLVYGLVDRSLVVRDGDATTTRFRLLESIREFAREQLARDPGGQTARQRHADHFLVASHQLTAHLHGAQRSAMMRAYDQEADNLRAALAYYVSTRQVRRARTLLVELAWMWTVGNRHDEAEQPVDSVIALGGPVDAMWWTLMAVQLMLRSGRTLGAEPESQDDAVEPVEAIVAGLRAHRGDGGFVPVMLALTLHQQGQHLSAHQVLDEELLRLESHARLSSTPVHAILLSIRAALAENLGDLDKLRESVEAVLDHEWTSKDPWALGQALEGRSYLRSLDGDVDGALADAQQAAALTDRLGEERIFLGPRLVQLHCARGDLESARAVLADADETRAELEGRDPRLGMFWTLMRAAAQVCIALTAEDDESLAEAGVSLQEVIDDREATAGMFHHLLAIAEGMLGVVYARSDPGRAAGLVDSAWRHATRTYDRPIMASVGEVLALLLAERPDVAGAARVLGAVDSLRGSPDPTSAVVRSLVRRADCDPRSSHLPDYAAARRLAAEEAIDTVGSSAATLAASIEAALPAP